MTLPDADDLAAYGGALNDYRAVVDPTVERPAALANKAYASIAMASRTVIRAWVSFLGAASNPAVVSHDAVWGNTVGVAPTIARSGAGVFTVTWPTSVTDQLGASHALNIRRTFAVLESSTLSFTQSAPLLANAVTVNTWNAAGAANDLVGVPIVVYIS